MAGRGRCAGCGREGSACKISAHILECPKYADVYRTDPAAALDPVAALAAWKNGQQQEAREAHRAGAAASHAQRRAAQSSRYARLPDPLEG